MYIQGGPLNLEFTAACTDTERETLKPLTFILWFLPRSQRNRCGNEARGGRPEIDSSPSPSHACRLCSAEMFTLSLPGWGAVCARTKGLQCPLLLTQLHKHGIYRHTQESITETFLLVMSSCWKGGTLLDMNANSRRQENTPSELAQGNTPPPTPYPRTPHPPTPAPCRSPSWELSFWGEDLRLFIDLGRFC